MEAPLLEEKRPLRSSQRSKTSVSSAHVSVVPYSPNARLPRPKRRKLKRKKQAIQLHSAEIFNRMRNKVKAHLSRIRMEQALLDAYTNEGWNRGGEKKILPIAEIARAQQQIIRCQVAIRQIIRDLESANQSDKTLDDAKYDEDGIDWDEIKCSRCNVDDNDSDNDVLLCDGKGCNRAYHQRCLSPPLRPDEIPEDWFCPPCDAKYDCLDYINEDVDDEWTCAAEVFPTVPDEDAALDPRQAAIEASRAIGANATLNSVAVTAAMDAYFAEVSDDDDWQESKPRKRKAKAASPSGNDNAVHQTVHSDADANAAASASDSNDSDDSADDVEMNKSGSGSDLGDGSDADAAELQDLTADANQSERKRRRAALQALQTTRSELGATAATTTSAKYGFGANGTGKKAVEAKGQFNLLEFNSDSGSDFDRSDDGGDSD
eukprot:TRINITY_DN14457_c0_g1_i1.p1 TRINITY_DN14457_c0_g1~~TRINITY_DN14457_c0_g1_i1.p1  ORF type:complete len:442 (-),score=104.02 TRINITY_DN14457_c0_g1_i1:38-1336(-)